MRISLQLCFHRLLVPHPVLHLYLVLTPHPVQILYYIWFFWNFAPDVLFPFFSLLCSRLLLLKSSSSFFFTTGNLCIHVPSSDPFFFFIPKILFSKTITAHLLDGFISRLILMLLQISPSPLLFTCYSAFILIVLPFFQYLICQSCNGICQLICKPFTQCSSCSQTGSNPHKVNQFR